MRKFALLTVCGLVVALAGCATAGSNKTAMRGSVSTDDEVDWAKMTIISRDAERRGYKVVWVHPPQKPRVAAVAERGAP